MPPDAGQIPADFYFWRFDKQEQKNPALFLERPDAEAFPRGASVAGPPSRSLSLSGMFYSLSGIV